MSIFGAEMRKKTVRALWIAAFVLGCCFGGGPADAVPYGQHNITGDGENPTTGRFMYPDIVKRHFDDKAKDVSYRTPTLERMQRSAENADPLASDLQGVLARATSHKELRAFVDGLPTAYMRRLSLGTFPAYTKDGRPENAFDVPVLIFSDPPTADVRRLKGTGKPIVYMQAQIHGNETSTCDALLTIAAALAANEGGLLDRLSVVLVPRLNPDGAWRFERTTNAAVYAWGGVDQNRDAVACLSPIVRATRNLLTVCRPDVFADFHEANYAAWWEDESLPGHGDTMGTSFYLPCDLMTLVAHPYNAPPRITALARRLEFGVWQALAKKGMHPAFFYSPAYLTPGYEDRYYARKVLFGGALAEGSVAIPGMFMEGPPDECISDSAVSLQPAVSILFEARSPKVLTNFAVRVHALHTAGMSLLEQVASEPEAFLAEVERACAEVTAMGHDPAEAPKIVLWSEQAKSRSRDLEVLRLSPNKDALTSETVQADEIFRNEGMQPVLSVSRPYAYVVSADALQLPAIVSRIALTGVQVRCLTGEAAVEAEVYELQQTASDEDDILGYATRRNAYFPIDPSVAYAIAEVGTRTEKVVFPPGTCFFYVAQPSAGFAALAVEPLANRNLGNYWLTLRAMGHDPSGFLPVRTGGDYPVYRLMRPAPLPSVPLWTEAPLLEGAYVRETIPFPVEETDASRFPGYEFVAGHCMTGGRPGPFRVFLPGTAAAASVPPVWFVYDWDEKRFLEADVETVDSVPTLSVGESCISETGEVRIRSAPPLADPGDPARHFGNRSEYR